MQERLKNKTLIREFYADTETRLGVFAERGLRCTPTRTTVPREMMMPRVDETPMAIPLDLSSSTFFSCFASRAENACVRAAIFWSHSDTDCFPCVGAPYDTGSFLAPAENKSAPHASAISSTIFFIVSILKVHKNFRALYHAGTAPATDAYFAIRTASSNLMDRSLDAPSMPMVTP